MPGMSARVAPFGTTIFAEINTLARQHNAVNLGQGAPDFDAPAEVIAAAEYALRSAQNQYAPGIGTQAAREAVAQHALRFYGQQIDPATEVLITAGATEAMFAAILGVTDPGDEVIVFAPTYDSYVPNMTMGGVSPRYVYLNPPDWAFTPAELAAAITPRTRAIIINTPHNPTGKVYNRAELEDIARLCQARDLIAITDEVYEHILYDGTPHLRLATLPGMAERTITISSLGKTFSVTGWKIGWVIASPALVTAVNRAHQFITYAVATPLQVAAAAALHLPDAYFRGLHSTFQRRRDYLMGVLGEAGFTPLTPQGGYFVMVDWRSGAPPAVTNDVQFAEWLIREVGVACIPPSAFYTPPEKHRVAHLARFAICKQDLTLTAAAERLTRVRR
ncbi:MAG TPA: aminotransferase class I/II-fold pyridoxal phosphate-dependent enzyme [Aggregatilineales bacterium]|nr:aminotransferase class I/II-fold pyridoxal phosphate-dependent enzyme [Anaerolineales bacterium]HRE47567.1 aminotransferase class I/II-fold pyridoxal phosphate-dependent enzyme [Aggregatilineales bacterium]